MTNFDLDAHIAKLDAVWKAQGRSGEQQYAVRNFLTGAGKSAIKALLCDFAEAITPEAKNTWANEAWWEGYNAAKNQIQQNTKQKEGK